MSEIDRTIQFKMPAQAVDTRPPALLLTAPYYRKRDLMREVERMAQRGQVRPIDARPRWDETCGEWQWRVMQLRPFPPAWRRPLLIGLTILAVFGIVLALAWWVLASLAALPLGLLCFAAVVGLWIFVRLGRTPIVQVIQNVWIK